VQVCAKHRVASIAGSATNSFRFLVASVAS
jgi:hypothetical protein